MDEKEIDKISNYYLRKNLPAYCVLAGRDCEYMGKKNELERELQAYRKAWNGLKEFISLYIEIYTCGGDVLEPMQRDILNRMQELEKDLEGKDGE